MLGAASGAVAGLVAITPAAGNVGLMGAIVIGFVAGFACLWGVNGLKRLLGADDSLDVFGVHGVGGISGAVAGLVAITPASGYVLPGSAIIIGIAAGVVCFWCATSLKHMLGYDDSLDVFGVHGVGGIIGALLTGVLSFGPLSATDALPDGSPGSVAQLWIQCQAVAATLIYSGVGTLILLMVTKMLVGLRVGEEEEREGLDLVLHGEQIF